MKELPALGARVALEKPRRGVPARSGIVFGFDFTGQRVGIRMDDDQSDVVVPLSAISDYETKKLLFREYRDELAGTGLQRNGISRRDFFAGYEAGRAA